VHFRNYTLAKGTVLRIAGVVHLGIQEEIGRLQEGTGCAENAEERVVDELSRN